MIWHQDKWLTPVLKGFMDVVREVLKAGELILFFYPIFGILEIGENLKLLW
jgi:hypothetical protein